MENAKRKTIFLEDGKEATLIATFQDEEQTKYVVRIHYDGDWGEEYEDKIVDQIFENYEEVPIVLRRRKYEEELAGAIPRLQKEVEKLEEQRRKLRLNYNPLYPIGTLVYHTQNGSKVEELMITKIVFTETKYESYYKYYCGNDRFEEVGINYFLSREEAEKKLEEVLADYLAKTVGKELAQLKQGFYVEKEFKNFA